MRVLTSPRQVEDLAGGAFVPTMGALHAGHTALIRRAVGLGGPVVVSVFVNPTQFGPGEDFTRYPRRLDEDAAAAAAAGAEVLFAPDVATVYPEGQDVAVPPLPPVATRPRLEDAHRPGHFAGVCQVVARLFDLVRPRWAVFGEKDFQQLRVVEAMVAAADARWGELAIVAHPTEREPSGLALSSRNAYLRPHERARALGLVRALQAAHATPHPETAERLMRETLAAHDLLVQYAVVRDAVTLMPVTSFERPARALIAACLGTVRLIDNMEMAQCR